MAKPKRAKLEIERDRKKINDLILEGRDEPFIRKAINAQYEEKRDPTTGAVTQPDRTLTRQAIQRDIDLVLEEWVGQAKTDNDKHRARELQTLWWSEREAREAWRRSQQPATETVTRMLVSNDELLRAARAGETPRLDKQESVTKTKPQVGDPRFLAEIRKLSRERRELLGLDLTKPTNRPDPEDQPDMEPAEAGALLMGLMARAVERFDTAMRSGALPAGVPVPAGLLPAGFQPPPGMVVSENMQAAEAAAIDVEGRVVEDELSDDEILDALEAEARRSGGGDRGGGAE